MLNVLTFSSNLAQLIEFWTSLETAIGAIARLCQLEKDIKPEQDAIEVDSTIPNDWPSDGGVAFSAVSASYDTHFPDVVHDVNLVIKPKEKLGICGRTGSGKSSLLSLLFRLLPTRSGSITIDGVDISSLPIRTLRSSMIAIPQEPLLFSGTVRFNIDPYSEPAIGPRTGKLSATGIDADAESDNAIINALAEVDLWDVTSSRGGLSAEISSIGFSHGQKQLFCLARALFRKNHSASNRPERSDTIQSRVLVLDEATSSVDIHTDALMRRVISSHFPDFTIITVAHRLSSLENCDRVLVMEGGRVVEIGEPAELMKRVGGLWRELRDA